MKRNFGVLFLLEVLPYLFGEQLWLSGYCEGLPAEEDGVGSVTPNLDNPIQWWEHTILAQSNMDGIKPIAFTFLEGRLGKVRVEENRSLVN